MHFTSSNTTDCLISLLYLASVDRLSPGFQLNGGLTGLISTSVGEFLMVLQIFLKHLFWKDSPHFHLTLKMLTEKGSSGNFLADCNVNLTSESSEGSVSITDRGRHIN